MFSVYVLKSRVFNRYYIGYSAHPQLRLEYHNAGKVRSTKAYAPFDIVHMEQFQTRSAAMCREKELKRMKTGNQFRQLLGIQDELHE